MRDWNGHIASVTAAIATAAAASAVRQPNASTSGGTANPAMTPPSGMPACLIENTTLRRASGVKRCSASLPAGLAMPLEKPISAHANSASASDGT